MKDLIGATISHYRIIEAVGRGGMGVVYRAEDSLLKRTVALKFLPGSLSADPEARERFVREAQAASALDHPNICTVHEIGECDGEMFMVMGYYEGQTLKKKIEDGRLKIEDGMDIAIQIAAGLTRAHEAGIVHRDIKPANIMLTNRGEVKILDFGLAKLSNQSMLTRAGSTLGTAAYMSPEQARGEEVDHRSDIWSLGVVMFEMLTGRTPFTSDYEQALIYAILNEDPRTVRSLNPQVPEVVEQIVQRAMAKDPDERYQKTAEFLSDLRIARGLSEPAGTQASAIAARTALQRRRTRGAAVAAGLVALMAAVYFIGWPLVIGSAPATPKPIAVISFENQTGLDSLDYLHNAIPNLLITSLEQSPHLRVTTWDRLTALLRRAKKTGAEFIDRTTGAELCTMDGAEAMVAGTIARAGDLYLTNLRIIDPTTNQTIITITAKGNGVESLLETQIDELSREIARGVGLSGRRLEEGSKPIAGVTTSSLEAYRHFLRGREMAYNFSGDPVPALRQAVSLDSSFAPAYLYLALWGQKFGETDTGRALITKARSLAWKAPEKERLLIEAHYAAWVENDLTKATTVLQETVRRFPGEIEAFRWIDQMYARMNKTDSLRIAALSRIIELDPEDAPATFFLAYMYAQSGDAARAYPLASRYRELRPNDASPWDVLGDIHLCLGNPDSAIACYAHAGSIDPTWDKGWKPAYALALQERYDESLKRIAAALPGQTNPEIRWAYLYWRCFFNYRAGKYREALRAIEGLRRSAHTPEEKDWLSDALSVGSCIARDLGRFREARRYLGESYQLPEKSNPGYSRYTDPTWYVNSGLFDIQEGRIDSARSRLASLHSMLASGNGFGGRTFTNYWYHLLRAEILLASDSAGQAANESGPLLDTLRLVMPNPAQMKTLVWYNLPDRHDVIARSYAKTGDLQRAIQAYEGLIRIDPNGLNRRLINPAYHYRLAKLYEQAEEKGKAIAAYSKFLEVWKNADSDLPLFVDAGRKLAILKR